MTHALQASNPPALGKAIEAAGIAIGLVLGLKPPLKSLADQVVRAAASMPANIAEAEGRAGGDRAYHRRVTYGSAKELDVHLRLLLSAAAVDADKAGEALELLDQVRAMLWRMLHPR